MKKVVNRLKMIKNKIINKVLYFFTIRYFIFICLLFLPSIVNASTINANNNISESTQVNYLIDMSISQVSDIEKYKYFIFSNGNDYFLVLTKDNVNINNNNLILSNTIIFKAIRTNQSGYNYYYEYSSLNESSTTIVLNNLIYSNYDTDYSMINNRFEEYIQKHNIHNGLIFLIGICFAIFLLKGRD